MPIQPVATTRQWYGRTRARRSARRDLGNRIARRDAVRAEHSMILALVMSLIPFAGPTLACILCFWIAHHFRFKMELRDKYRYVITAICAIGFTALAFIVSQLYVGDDGFKFHTTDSPWLKFLSFYFGALLMPSYSIYRLYKSEAYHPDHWPQTRAQPRAQTARLPPAPVAADEPGDTENVPSPPSVHQPRHSTVRPLSQHSNGGEGPSNWHNRPSRSRNVPQESIEMEYYGSSDQESSGGEAHPTRRASTRSNHSQ
ncbi:hypothetical protein JCM5353_005378 [Sporobolomyces roseus]